jgi:hypothetical protein
MYVYYFFLYLLVTSFDLTNIVIIILIGFYPLF